MYPDNNKDIQLVNTNFDSPGLTLNDFWGMIIESRWLIAGVVFIFSLVGALYVFIAQPVYRSDALLRVDQEAAGIGALGDFSELSGFVEANTVEMEMEILKSRMVLGEVVDKFNLDVNAEPAYFPVLGAAIARRNIFGDAGIPVGTVFDYIAYVKELSGGWLDPHAWLDFSKYAWGGERIAITRFDIPAAFRGKAFTLIAGEDGRFQLRNSKHRLLATGTAGEPTRAWLPTEKPHTLLVTKLKARSGTHFELSRKPRLKAIDDLKESLEVTPLGNTDQSTYPLSPAGLLHISLDGPDPEKITTVINEIIELYVRQNAERKSADVKRTLAFLRKQLPRVKARVEKAEVALNDYRQRQGSVDVPLETRTILGKIVTVENERSQLRKQRQALLRRFTPSHDRVVVFDAQLATMKKRQRRLEREVQRLPRTQQEILRLSRDVEVNGRLYTLLLNRAQELQVVEAGNTGNVRIVDAAAIPYDPVGLNGAPVIAIILAAGTLSGIGAALLRKCLLSGAVEDPDTIEKQLGLPVYAVVPHSAKQDKLSRRRRLSGMKRAVLSARDTEDFAIESVRSLRTWLSFAFVDAKNNVLLITGPGPGVGKSFLSMNLGVVMASAGKRVLIIDADMRKGHLHRNFGVKREAGLSDVIAGAITTGQAIHKTETDELFIVPTGSLPPNPSELLMNDRLASILEELSGQFDFVIIDSPPVLAVTDAVTIGSLAAGALLVVKANTHPLRELEHSVAILRRSGVNVLGVVFNDMEVSSGRYGYGKYYGYAYPAYYKAT